jgi:hypothetical protein
MCSNLSGRGSGFVHVSTQLCTFQSGTVSSRDRVYIRSASVRRLFVSAFRPAAGGGGRSSFPLRGSDRSSAAVCPHSARNPKASIPSERRCVRSHGAEVYRRGCAFCHGVPGRDSVYGASMYPAAPQLWHKHSKGNVVGVSDDEVGETYWKVKNGIRLTGCLRTRICCPTVTFGM